MSFSTQGLGEAGSADVYVVAQTWYPEFWSDSDRIRHS